MDFYYFFMDLPIFFIGILFSLAKMKCSIKEIGQMVTSLIYKEHKLSSQVTRLVVLVPLMDLNTLSLSKKITDLAGDRIRHVLYLAVPQNPDEEMILTGKLHHLYAATHSDYIHVDTLMQYGSSWRKALRGLWKPGDVVVCPEGYAVRWRVLWHKPLNSVLSNVIHVPFYLMPFNNHTVTCYQREEVKREEVKWKKALREWNSNGHKKNKEN